MEKHLICLDLDGTLLTDEKEISPFTKKVLLELKKKGHELMISTGRPYRASEPYYRELDMTTPIVNFNGAFVHHPSDLYFRTVHEELDLEVAQEIVRRVPDLNIQNIIAEVKDNVYLHYHDEVLFEAFSMGNPEIRIGDLTQTIESGPTTILIQAEEPEVPNIRQALDDLFADTIEHRRWGAPYPVIEIVKKGINKAVGVNYVRGYMGIDQKNIIAFGDEDNDTEMIKYAEHGVAMGNAIKEIQDAADYAADTNNNDGIGQFLNDFFKLRL
ncbi:Cof-type HAD-IIB family hydrolase [Salinicoccus jeotgali]|uniref:Cof-type HAD-IIB family hydrolase n=1 Tax=Salinicoccus jeotgali TaxID=381634 RepID=A0ABP7F6G4_9STAP